MVALFQFFMVSTVAVSITFPTTYLQGSHRDTDVENGCVNTGAKGEGEMNLEIRIDMLCVF